MNRKRLRVRVRSQKRFPIPVLVAAVLLYALLFWRAHATLSAFVLDVFLAAAGLLFWLFFFAQFVLPVQQITDRMRAFDRLSLFITRNHGPAIFIENGEVREHKGELTRKGPGVVLLDTASAAVLRTPVRFTRAAGPGVIFTEGNETIAGVVDLRLQHKSCGPRENEDPFGARHPNEEYSAYEGRQRRRQETRALTRDGIEIVPTIEVTFRIDSRYGEGSTEFGFNSNAVERAVIGRNINLNQSPENSEHMLDWQWLPLRMAADVWKESLSKFTLDELFRAEGGLPGAIETVREIVAERLMHEEACCYDAFGRKDEPAARFERCEPFWKLKARGIQVTQVEILHLRMPENVEKELLQRWKASWLTHARHEHDLVERRRSRVSELGRQDALREFTLATSKALSDVSTTEELTGRTVLQRLIRGTLELPHRDPRLLNFAAGEVQQVTELLEWVEAQPEQPQ